MVYDAISFTRPGVERLANNPLQETLEDLDHTLLTSAKASKIESQFIAKTKTRARAITGLFEVLYSKFCIFPSPFTVLVVCLSFNFAFSITPTLTNFKFQSQI